MSTPESNPEITRWCALTLALGLGIAAAASVAGAIQAERTGAVPYSSNVKLFTSEYVSKTESPEKFRRAVIKFWIFALCFGGISFACFRIYRRLSD